MNEHWRSSEKVPQLACPNHPYYAQTKKSPAILKTLICSTDSLQSNPYTKEYKAVSKTTLIGR